MKTVVSQKITFGPYWTRNTQLIKIVVPRPLLRLEPFPTSSKQKPTKTTMDSTNHSGALTVFSQQITPIETLNF